MLTTDQFISELEKATHAFNGEQKVLAVKEVLGRAFRAGLELAPKYYKQQDGHYARRLLHKAADGSFSVVVMVWDVDQKTPLHDHDGRWCVECVLKGMIKVTSFEHVGKSSCGGDLFERRQEVLAGEGQTGHLIPPFEYHEIANALDKACSVTLHVYDHELLESTVFVPRGDGSYDRERQSMTYD